MVFFFLHLKTSYIEIPDKLKIFHQVVVRDRKSGYSIYIPIETKWPDLYKKYAQFQLFYWVFVFHKGFTLHCLFFTRRRRKIFGFFFWFIDFYLGSRGSPPKKSLVKGTFGHCVPSKRCFAPQCLCFLFHKCVHLHPPVLRTVH